LLERRRGAGGASAPAPLVLPAYEATLKCSHLFNVLDARGALSVTERAAHIQRIRRLACDCARAWLARRESQGFPLAASPEVARR
jgi:glycyl-tRNA synthetase alpha chain